MLVLVAKGGCTVARHVIPILVDAGSRWAGEGALPGGSKGHALPVEVKWNIFTVEEIIAVGLKQEVNAFEGGHR